MILEEIHWNLVKNTLLVYFAEYLGKIMIMYCDRSENMPVPTSRLVNSPFTLENELISIH